MNIIIIVKHFMILLAFETCFKGASVSIFKDGKVFTREEKRESKQSDSIFELTAGLLNEAGVSFKDVNLILSNKGPGSFTGVRIGLSFTSGLSFGSSVERRFANSFGVALASLPDLKLTKNLLVVLRAMRDTFYIQKFNEKLEEIGEAKHLNLKEVNEILQAEDLEVFGNLEGLKLVKDGIVEDAKINSESVIKAYLRFPSLFKADVKPFYLRPAIVKNNI
jgi:tRNA threonylcarbamoyladenosine biosynthesis protein TsaB